MKLLPLVLLLTLAQATLGQVVTYNYVADSASAEVKSVMRLFENYIGSNPQDKKQNPYWNAEEQKQFKNFDFLESEFQPSLYMGFPVHVLSIKSEGGTYFIKAQFSYTKADGSPYVLAIVNYIAKKEKGSDKLYNALPHNKQHWNCTTVGLIDFYYPKYHAFNANKAAELVAFVNQLCADFNVAPKPFDYYFADDYDEVQQLKGIDYYLGMGGEIIPSGKAGEDKVYCGGMGEYFPHEVVHVMLNPEFPNAHFWSSEGLATYLGGSRGETLAWHIKRTNAYLKAHPEIDLNEMLTLSNLDEKTAYHYVLGGLIVKKVHDKGGWALVKEFLRSGKTDHDYYRAIEKYLGIKQPELNTYLRGQLEIEAES